MLQFMVEFKLAILLIEDPSLSFRMTDDTLKCHTYFLMNRFLAYFVLLKLIISYHFLSSFKIHFCLVIFSENQKRIYSLQV